MLLAPCGLWAARCSLPAARCLLPTGFNSLFSLKVKGKCDSKYRFTQRSEAVCYAHLRKGGILQCWNYGSTQIVRILHRLFPYIPHYCIIP